MLNYYGAPHHASTINPASTDEECQLDDELNGLGIDDSLIPPGQLPLVYDFILQPVKILVKGAVTLRQVPNYVASFLRGSYGRTQIV